MARVIIDFDSPEDAEDLVRHLNKLGNTNGTELVVGNTELTWQTAGLALSYAAKWECDTVRVDSTI